MRMLKEIGFLQVGYWHCTREDILECKLERLSDSESILYCFVSNNEILYIGKTVMTLSKRMYGYTRPGPRQSTNIRNRKAILELLSSGQAVDIFVLADNEQKFHNGYKINFAASLEDSLIVDLKS